MSVPGPLFSTTAVIHGVTEVIGGLPAPAEGASPAELPIRLRTPPSQWAYGVWFERLPDVDDAAILVEVQLRVSQGTIGVGLLHVDADRFVEESIVSPAPDLQRIAVVSPSLVEVGWLVVRNLSSDGPSEAEVITICSQTIVDDDDNRQPPLTEPHPTAHWSRYYGNERLSPLERLRVMRFERLQNDAVIGWSNGLAFQVRPRDQLSRAVFVSGTYEPNSLSVFRRALHPGDTFIDVGANAGLITLAAASWVGPMGRVYAFEPSSREFERLGDTVRRNRLSQVTMLRKAVGATSGTATLRIAADGLGGLNTIGKDFAYSDVDLAGTEQVDVIALDPFVLREGVRAAALKIDVEGGEADVLRGARILLLRDRPVVILEVFNRALAAMGSSLLEVQALLRDCGYVLHSFRDDGTLAVINDLTTCDEQNIVALPAERGPAL